MDFVISPFLSTSFYNPGCPKNRRWWTYPSLCFRGGPWKDCVCKNIGMEQWKWGVEWCRISWPWAAWDSTQWILFCFYEQHFFISQWRRLGQIFLTLLGDRIDSWHWLLDMTGCVPKHSSGDKGNAKLVRFYPIGHLFFTAFPCLIF